VTPEELAALVQASVLRRFEHEERKAKAEADLAEHILKYAQEHTAKLELPALKLKPGPSS
jgi:hypothetical protein